MYEQFTDQSRKVMQLANQECQRFNNEYISPAHVLLGLVKEGSGVTSYVLKNLDIDLRSVRLEVEKRIQSVSDMPQTPNTKKVIEHAIEEARSLNHNYVGTEHILLGLLRLENSVATDIIAELLEADIGEEEPAEFIRAEVLNLLGRREDSKKSMFQKALDAAKEKMQ